MIKYSLIIFLVIITGAVVILLFEYKNTDSNIKNVFDAIWWSLVTITTVGYGDLVPITFWGRIIGIIFILMGFILFSIFTAFIASSFIDRKIKEGRGMSNIKEKQHILVCGWNSSVLKILDFLKKVDPKEKNPIVLLNELDEGRISTIINHYPQLEIKFISGDY
ncbi:MAG: two pore domain potassium channel family protein, partial [Candidatus Cloacimonetes bacterium]|nr:two pore domain potassium channel family protein [Candidatus Cloacimonadota bacterium]